MRKDNSKKEGIYKSIYQFDAINAQKECGKDSKCANWSMKGDYRIITGPTGGSSVVVHAQVQAARKIDTKTQTIGVGWGLSYDKNDAKTELYVAYH
jgi:hypothetical protein